MVVGVGAEERSRFRSQGRREARHTSGRAVAARSAQRAARLCSGGCARAPFPLVRPVRVEREKVFRNGSEERPRLDWEVLHIEFLKGREAICMQTKIDR